MSIARETSPRRRASGGGAHARGGRAARGPAAAVVLTLATLAGAARAAEPAAAGELSLEAAVATALDGNPELRSMAAQVEAMRERPAREQALPNPMLSYGAMGPQDDFRFPDGDEKRVGLEQPVPWFGKRALRGRIAGAEAAAMEGDYAAMRREVAMMTREAYYELYALERVLGITRGQGEVLGRMEQAAQTKYAAGSVEQQDVIKAQAETTMLRQRLIDLEQRRDEAQARLARLLGLTPGVSVGRPATPPPAGEAPELAALLAAADRDRPEIAAARAREEQAGLERRLMGKESFPDLTLGVESRTYREGDDMLMAMVRVELPVWRSGIGAGVREAARMAESRQAGVEAARRQVAYEVEAARSKVEAARRTLALYREALLPQAAARFAASEAGYRAGKSDFLDLLESQRFLLEASVMAAMGEGDLGMQWARLDRAIGAGAGAEGGVYQKPGGQHDNR